MKGTSANFVLRSSRLSALLVGGLAAAARLPAARSDWEPARTVVWLLALAAGGLVLALGLTALDVARVQIAETDAGRVRGALRAGLAAVCRRPWVWLGAWLVNAALLGVGAAAYVVCRSVVPAGTTPLIALMVLAQQAFALYRAWLRVALWGSTLTLARNLAPAAEAWPA